jgi:hypothetical protein
VSDVILKGSQIRGIIEAAIIVSIGVTPLDIASSSDPLSRS